MGRLQEKRQQRDADLIVAVQKSRSVRQVLAHLQLVEAGGNYASIQRRIKELGLSTMHFKGQGWRQKQVAPVVPPKPLSELLKAGVNCSSYKLKLRLLKEGLKIWRCESCDLERWMNDPIPLELDHINGERDDNRLENLRLLCPNCHAQTSTYRGKKLAKCRDETAPA